MEVIMANYEDISFNLEYINAISARRIDHSTTVTFPNLKYSNPITFAFPSGKNDNKINVFEKHLK